MRYRKQENSSVEHRYDDIKTAVGAQMYSGENRRNEEARIRSTLENLEENSRYVFALPFLRTYFFSLFS